MNESALKQWLTTATGEEIEKLADIADTSVQYLHHLAMGRRKASAELSGKIEEAALLLRMENRTLPDLTRGDVSPVCRACPYYRQCKGVGDAE